MISFSDIEDAFLFVSSSSYGMNSAFLRKDTGQILYRSDCQKNMGCRQRREFFSKAKDSSGQI